MYGVLCTEYTERREIKKKKKKKKNQKAGEGEG
ncbi:hypothetical protein VN97_g11644, partial [Penicillium thymicola]